MAETVIEWVRNPQGELGFTFNAWIGCEHVSPACDHCYAEVDAPARVLRAKGMETWGPRAERYRTSEANWRQPLRWNRRAAAKGTRLRVFSASQSDWLDNKVPIEWLVDLLDLIRRTPHLDWLLLTKRIGNWRKRLQEAATYRLAVLLADTSDPMRDALYQWIRAWLDDHPPSNVWLGETIVNQEEADRDIIKLLRTPAAVRFLSMEPLLGPVNIACIDLDGHSEIYPLRGTTGCQDDDGEPVADLPAIDWVIVGGESGHKARPMLPCWATGIRDQCEAAGVSFFFKQWGEWHTSAIRLSDGLAVFRQFTDFQHWVNKASTWVNGGICLDRHGRELKIGGDFMRARDEGHFPVTIMHRVGKANSGRLLDGKPHDASPSGYLR